MVYSTLSIELQEKEEWKRRSERYAAALASLSEEADRCKRQVQEYAGERQQLAAVMSKSLVKSIPPSEKARNELWLTCVEMGVCTQSLALRSDLVERGLLTEDEGRDVMRQCLNMEARQELNGYANLADVFEWFQGLSKEA